MDTRLEDLAYYERAFLEDLPQDGTVSRRALWPRRLAAYGLIHIEYQGDVAYVNLSDAGRALLDAATWRRSQSNLEITKELAQQATDLQSQLDVLKAENARLQKALEEIVLETTSHGWIADIEVIAREALQEAQS